MRQCLWRIEKVCPTLDSLDIGGGWPIRHSLGFEYDYEYMAEQIIKSIQSACKTQGVDEPNIYSGSEASPLLKAGLRSTRSSTRNSRMTVNCGT